MIASAFLLAAPLACVESQTRVPPHLGGAIAPVTPSSTVPTVGTITPPSTTATPPIEPVVVPVNGGAVPVTTCPNDHPTS